MKRYFVPAIVLAVFFLAGRFWSELGVTATGQGSGGAFAGNGDVNGDGTRDISDAVALLNWLFLGGKEPVACADGGSGLTPEQEEILGSMSIVSPAEMGGKKTIRISGVNVQIVNGMNVTATNNGTGNLIVGYNELRNDPASPDFRTGSHNIVGGSGSNYLSYGGLVVGHKNSISGIYSSVSAGTSNVADGSYSSVSGGSCNVADGISSSVSGGGSQNSEWGNKAWGDYSSIGGGANNRAWSDWSCVVGGRDNIAGKIDGSTGVYSTVSGGRGNRTNGDDSSVSGGNGSTTSKSGEVLGDSFSKPRFVDNGDGTVTDKQTGLMWQRDTDPTTRNWDDSHHYCVNLDLADHQDWRMPSLEELLGIVDETRSPAIDPAFQAVRAWYWASTSVIFPPELPRLFYFHVYFADGSEWAEDRENLHYVRAVRTGQ